MSIKEVTSTINGNNYKSEKSLDTADLRYIILTSELGNQMLDTVAPIYDQSKLTLYTFEAFAETLEKETAFVEGDFIRQMFPQTATWGISLWEDEYGITPDASKTIEQRRTYLMSAMCKKQPMTPQRLKQVVKGVTGYDSEIVEHVDDNTILVVVYGYVWNLKQLTDELNRKIPAHLNYILKISDIEDTGTATTAIGFAMTEFEHYDIDVFNPGEGGTIAITQTGFAIVEHEKIELEVSQ